MRITLGTLLFDRAIHRAQGKPDYPILFDDDETANTGNGTPHRAPAARYLRTDWMVTFSFVCGKQTPAKIRDVHVSPMQAFAQLSTTFHGLDQTAITRLAMDLLSVVEKEELLRGYSAICVAGACIRAAEQAFQKPLLRPDLLKAVGVEVRAIDGAYADLKDQVFRKLWAVRMVMTAKGDPNHFPGKPLISSKEIVKTQRVSQLTIIRARMMARGGSCLRSVVNADELPDPVPAFSMRKRRSSRYYAGQQEDMIFDFEDDGERGRRRKMTSTRSRLRSAGKEEGKVRRSRFKMSGLGVALKIAMK